MAGSEEFRELVARIVAGNTGEFREIVEKHQKLVAHIVFRMVTSEADREDICQEVFVKVFRNLASFKFDCKLSTWIATIAYNTSLNHLDKKKLPLYDDLAFEDASLEDRPADIEMPDSECEAKDISAILRKEINGLPPRYRTILALYHLDEMSYREIGQITKLSDGTVKSHLFRARKLLRERLTAKYRQEDLCR
ncbi:MAG: sigma-70 family RNA polymerase sigma factor [Candidatus Zixiibacteriota bacterium]|nr:MAG: sigma-70 family RNA polymerase sigma factor [candidate division Zixibacteria bacterium]